MSSSTNHSNINNYDYHSSSENQPKTTQDLQIQWAGGRDVWPKVPRENGDYVSIQTKVKDDKNYPRNSCQTMNDWPKVVKESILFGFGAFNPRGKVVPHDVNESQHTLLKEDIEAGISDFPHGCCKYWEGASIWEDGSTERGFVVAFRKDDIDDNVIVNGLDLCTDLARKYDQGAIYRFNHEDGKLMRDTIAVLDEGTDARVEVEIDAEADLSRFL